MWNGNGAMETVNAAASAIAFADARAPPNSFQKKRWSGCLSAYWCFGSRKQNKRIGRAVLVPEPASTATESPPRDFVLLPSFSAPFAAPPSSPASFVPTEPPSASQSPAALLSFTSLASNMYSPGGPRSIFTTGPYAYETQLVSPPAFSTYTTTEPSTAPFTPPPESVHMTTPSSPEVPFAHFLDPGPNSSSGHRYMPAQFDFQSYQYYPGSPAGQLISPGSVISGSGTSSPLPDQELFTGGHYYTDVRFGVPPKLLNQKLLPACGWGSGQESGSLTPDRYLLDRSNNTVSFLPSMRITDDDEDEDDEFVVSQRVSFELALDDVARCVEKGRMLSPQALQTAASEENTLVGDDKSTGMIAETSREDATEKLPVPADVEEQRSVSLESTKEFNFDNVNNEESRKPCLGPIWWTNDTVNGKEEEHPRDHWNFFHAL